MDLIKAVFFAVLGILAAVLGILAAAASRQLTDEFKAWTPTLVDHIIRRAVRQLPENQRERFAEEWQSHISDIPGEVGKLIVAFGFLAASRKMGDSDDRAKLGKEIVIVEEEPEALPPVDGSNMPAIFGWMSNRTTDDAVMETILFRHRQAINAIASPGNFSIAPATATAVARDLSSPPPAAGQMPPAEAVALSATNK